MDEGRCKSFDINGLEHKIVYGNVEFTDFGWMNRTLRGIIIYGLEESCNGGMDEESASDDG